MLDQGISLDSGPPLPPNATQQLPPQDNMLMGQAGGSPAIMGLQYLQQAKNALLGLTSIFPEVADILNPTVAGLEQLVTKAMADKVSGTIPNTPGVAAPVQSPPPTGPSGNQGSMGM